MDGDLKHLASSDQKVKSDSPCIYLISLWIERLMTFDLDLDLYIGLTIISCFHIKKSFFWKFLEEIQVTRTLGAAMDIFWNNIPFPISNLKKDQS